MKAKILLPWFLTTISFLCLSVIEIKAQDSLYLVGTITGESVEKKIVGVKGIGDVNGDGYGDFMISMRTGKTRSDQGIAKLFLGSANIDLTPDLIFHYPGKDSLNEFGNASGVGDVNGDGYDDFTISGAFGDWGFPKGKVFLYYGGETIEAIPVAEFYGYGVEDRFGEVTKLGDLNKDGFDDFTISSPYNWSNGKGYVYLFWGGDTVSFARSITFTSDILENFFGESAANIGDVNKDGFDDIAIGASGGPSVDTPTVYIYYGGNVINTIPEETLIGGGVVNIGDINGDERPEFIVRNVEETNIYFSLDSMLTLKGVISYIIGGGNINNDGYDDFVIVNSNYRNSDNIMVGETLVYLGFSVVDTLYDFMLEGETKWSLFGATSFADINGDDYDELLILAPNYPDNENPLGKIYIYSYNNVDDVKDIADIFPNNFNLYQNYPNPFNPGTIISWQSPVFSHITIKIFDVLGKEVATLLNEERPAGRYKVEFDASKYKLSSGLYFCELKIKGGGIRLIKMLFLK